MELLPMQGLGERDFCGYKIAVHGPKNDAVSAIAMDNRQTAPACRRFERSLVDASYRCMS
jgi:hypothetical protein